MQGKIKKILIIGFGSIGKRHFKNLKALGFRNVLVYEPNPSQYKGFDISTLEKINLQALAQFNVVFICTPSHLHIKTALLAAEAGCHLFIEKPLSNSMKDLWELMKLAKQKKLTTMVAANMRFHPAFAFVKKYLDSGKLGKVYRISHEFGYYLPLWRPGTDYKKGYAMRKKTGGGILLDDIHEFDLLFWLLDFKKPTRSHIVRNKMTNLTIDTEDQASAVFLFPDGIIGTVSSDYLSKKYHRTVLVVGEKGNLTWDFTENVVWLETEKGKRKLFSAKGYDTNDMYKEELRYFLDCVSKNKNTENEIFRAVFLLKELGIK